MQRYAIYIYMYVYVYVLAILNDSELTVFLHSTWFTPKILRNVQCKIHPKNIQV